MVGAGSARPRDMKDLEAPPAGWVRKITAREAAHIAALVETVLERDSAFLFSYAQAINLLAKRKHLRGD